MNARIPVGLSQEEWNTVTEGLESHTSTVNDYRKVLNLLHSYDNGRLRITTMSHEDAEEYFRFLDERQEAGTLSPNTAHRYKATLRAISARIASNPDLWPDYKNPFSGLLKNEERKRTEYTMEMFPSSSDVAKLRAVLPKLDKEDALILRLMMNIGLTPTQVQNLKISNFTGRRRHESGPISVHLEEGTFLENTSKFWKESSYFLDNYPVRYVRRSSGRMITWSYTGTFCFSEDFEKSLLDYYSYTGESTDTRNFFLTSRHLEYNYRAMHHMLLSACQEAGISSCITPYQLSRYGLVRSYVMDQALRENDAGLREKLMKEDWIGDWKDRYPIPQRIQIESIQKTLGSDALLKIIGH